MRMDLRYWNRRLELLRFISAFPWEWPIINWQRRRDGLPPLRYFQSLRELREGGAETLK